MNNGWKETGGALSRAFTFPTYLAGLEFASAVGREAERQNHHPDILIGYKKVTVTTTTHDAGNTVTERDRKLAAAIDALARP
ncbi:MAG: 4a-hydroxytetrahydrobiopterin dehydratase [Nitrospinae bacterium]|nr:4a-hydroxytetrahydrobiopterin dehydratase [Nitrospinota bacterium]